jgi:hypothetical protein
LISTVSSLPRCAAAMMARDLESLTGKGLPGDEFH